MRKKYTISFNKNGLTLNGRITTKQSNGSRTVYLNNNYVIKLECLSGNVKDTQSYNEFKTYKEIQREDKKYFAKVLEFGTIQILDNKFCYIIQKYIPENNKVRTSKEIIQKVNELGEKYRITDLHSDNWCLDEEGNPVIFDLGYSGTKY